MMCYDKNLFVRKIKIVLCIVITLVLCSVNISEVNAKYNMTYLYGSGNYVSLVDRTSGALDEVSPSYFDIDSNGNLILNPVDSDFVNSMHSRGIKVVPFLSNHWNRANGRAGLENREELSSMIAEVVKKNNLDGVNVDIENVTETDRVSYTELIRLLRNKIPSNKSVVVSVAANPYNLNTGWQGSYDYAELAKYSDYLMIMAYDEHYESGTAGSVAGIEFVRSSIEYATKYVPKEKIVLGIPLYGRYWKNGASYGGEAISLEKVNELLGKYQNKVEYDEATKSAKATIVIKNGDVKPKVSGKTWGTGTYVIWYENDMSIKEKLTLVNEYDIKGAGTWKLGLEPISMWEIFRSHLKVDENLVFTDVKAEHWASEAILALKDKNIMEGKADRIFKPEDSLTRAELATIICRIINEKGTLENDVKYTDIGGHWAENYINQISKLGITNGYGDGTFRPDNLVSRAEATKIICKTLEMLNLDGNDENEEESTIEFYDVPKGFWAIEYIEKLSQNKIIDGYKDGTFKPDSGITRAEIAKIIYKILSKEGRP